MLVEENKRGDLGLEHPSINAVFPASLVREPENNNYKLIFQSFFKPIKEMQKATTKEITEGLKPIKKDVDNLLQAITFPAYSSVQAADKETATDKETDVAPYYIGNITESYLRKFITKSETRI